MFVNDKLPTMFRLVRHHLSLFTHVSMNAIFVFAPSSQWKSLRRSTEGTLFSCQPPGAQTPLAQPPTAPATGTLCKLPPAVVSDSHHTITIHTHQLCSVAHLSSALDTDLSCTPDHSSNGFTLAQGVLQKRRHPTVARQVGFTQEFPHGSGAWLRHAMAGPSGAQRWTRAPSFEIVAMALQASPLQPYGCRDLVLLVAD